MTKKLEELFLIYKKLNKDDQKGFYQISIFSDKILELMKAQQSADNKLLTHLIKFYLDLIY